MTAEMLSISALRAVYWLMIVVCFIVAVYALINAVGLWLLALVSTMVLVFLWLDKKAGIAYHAAEAALFEVRGE